MQNQHFPLNTRFKPSTAMMTWYRAGIALLFGLLLLFSYVPAVLFGEMPAIFSVLILGSTALIFILLWIWVGKYYDSMFYELRDDEINWKRGVWFRTTGIVPYNRITNLDVRQGPFMRMLKISNLAMQTAGYSGQAVPEIQIEAIEHAEELRELIRSLIRGSSSHDDGTGSAKPSLSPTMKTTDQQILAEVQQIRSLLEQRR
ncbi:MAG TPA: PH domain-containing protein [Methanoregula sp.]|nr:PH domain-containing protein [Methanoregula sp.]